MIRILMLLSQLPLSVLYKLSDLLAVIARRYYRRSVVVANLKECFPQWAESEVNNVADQFYVRFSDFLVETIKGLGISQSELKKRVEFVNPEVVEKTESGPVLIFAAHQMNWEWMSLASAFYFPFHSEVIYRPLTDETSERLMIRLRSRFGNRLLERDKSVRHILKNKNKRRAIGIVADQLPRHKMDKVWTFFLKRETPFYKGIDELPYLLQSPAFFAKITRKKRGYYEVKFISIGEPPYQKGETGVLKNYIAESEAMIKAAPENWLWSHRRWKYQRRENEELTIL